MKKACIPLNTTFLPIRYLKTLPIPLKKLEPYEKQIFQLRSLWNYASQAKAI